MSKSAIKKIKELEMLHKSSWRKDIIYDIEKLWKLDKGRPQFSIEISDLNKILKRTLWSTKEGLSKDDKSLEKSISPMDVLRNPSISKYHKNSIKYADLSYPIILLVLDDGTFDVIDGIHRLAKAYSKGDDTIEAVIPSDEILISAMFPIKKFNKPGN